jgi:dinuclear metal center YbgI/SA1388 family protein
MKIRELTQFLERIAPPQYQESYDNAGLIVGNPDAEITGILTCLDSTEAIVNEAVAKGCNLIVAHHPIVFKGLKRLNGRNYVERTILAAIKNEVAIYAIHTNLDSVLRGGVNTRICERLGLTSLKILSPKRQSLTKLVTFIPLENTQNVLTALYAAGAGQIGEYKNCSFRTQGIGTFLPTGEAQPHIGTLGQIAEVSENRVEVIFPNFLQGQILHALRKSHPYEEVAYYLQALENENQEVGAGMVGDLAEAMDELEFLYFLKETMQTKCVRHTLLRGSAVKRVAVCGGSGSFLLRDAISSGADVFVTADFKYHEFFDAEKKLVIADIGHFESEQFTIDLLKEHIEQFLVGKEVRKNLTKKYVFSTEINTNPVNYL